MENFASLLIPALMLFGLIRVIMLPIRIVWKLLINSTCGFACLWILNGIAPFTGILFPINAVTAAIAGFLGLPGIALLAITQMFL